MYKHVKKGLALFLAAVMVLACLPVQARAAEEAPAFQKKYSVFYENRSNKGIYDLTVNHVQKGYKLKWRITGKGKSYASFDTAKTIAESTSVTNRLTINSRQEAAYAAAERIRITVNVYTAKWELVQKLTFAGRLQSKAKAIAVDTSGITDLNHLTPGQTYAFAASMTPANATSKIYWQVKDAAGTDCSSEITPDGSWTPSKAGTYTITALAKNSEAGQALCTNSVTATVGSFIESVTQTAADGVNVTFNMAAAAQYQEAHFTIKSGEATVLVKKVKYSDDGRTAYLTTAANFIDGRKYTVSCAGASKEFTASAGKPTQLTIRTSAAQTEKYTTIEYVLLDANGIDVTKTVKDGAFTYTANVNNGFLDKETNRLYMTTIGSIATVTMIYTSPDGTIRLEDTKTVMCVPQQAQIASGTRFTLTDSAVEPAYSGNDVRTIAVGDTMYAHFRGLDEDENAITYDSVTYASSDPDKLIISPEGRITPIKPGSVTVTVTAKQGNDTVPYTYQITINAGRYLASIQMKEASVSMSNTNLSDYQKEVPVTALDQYGNNYALTGETGIITESGGRALLASYDAAGNTVLIRAQGAAAGTYNYTLTITMDGVSVTYNFFVIVSVPVENGAVTYKAETSADTMDLSINADTTGNQSIRIRLAEYRGGVFYGYKNFVNAEIRKGSLYYGSDLVTSTSGSAIRLPGANVLTLTPMSVLASTDGSGIGTCQKAEPGVYTVFLTYADSAYRYYTENINITITDGQNPPEYTMRSYTTSAPVVNALQMVNDCVYIPDGTILDCTAAGTRLTGSAIPIKSGEQLHINTITVKSVVTLATGQKVYVTHVITIDKTLTNK